MKRVFLTINRLNFIVLALLAFSYPSAAKEQPNQFGAFIGGYGEWYAYIVPSTCHLAEGSTHSRELVASFNYGDENDFNNKIVRTKNSKFSGPSFDKIKELLWQVCILKNSSFSIKNAQPDFVLCSRDEPTGRIVLWDWPAVTKEGFLSVDNKVIDGLVFTTGNGHRRDYYASLFGHEGKRYLDMYKLGEKEIYTQILINYAKPFWYDCNNSIEVSSCRSNFKEKEFERTLFDKIFNAVDGLWSNQFCKNH